MQTPFSLTGTTEQPYHPEEAVHNPSGRKAMSTQKVLIVDDETDIVDELIEMLEDEGLTVVGAFDASKAIEMINTDREIAVVLSDIRMPGMDGLAMARYIHSDTFEGRELSVIIMTGHAGMSEAIEALQIGAEDFLTKPINPEQLVHAVKRSLETVRLRERDRNYTKDLAEEVQRKTAQALKLSEKLEIKNAELLSKNEELDRSARLKDEFLGMISHELNTPLNAMIGFAHILQADMATKGEKAAIENAQCIVDAGERLMKNVKSILTLADIQAGHLTANKQETLIVDLVDSAISANQKMLDEKSAQITKSIGDGNLMVSVDPGLMKAALVGIVENAVKFSNDGADIHISAEEDGSATLLTIADNGPGIPENILGDSKELFRQGDGSLQRRFEGMGLGLPLAHRICSLQGGRLDVVSNAETGTRASFVFPRTAAS